MRIVTFARIRNFIEKRPDAEVAIKEWYSKTSRSNWTCFADVINTFNSVDSVGNNRFIFNIKGNTYRLIAIIIFKSQKVYIRFIGNHSEYDKINPSNI